MGSRIMAVKTLFIVLIYIHMTLAKVPDWLVTRVDLPVTCEKTSHNTLLLTNGLLSREFQLHPGFFTVDYYSFEKQSSLLRAVGPEAQISLDGTVYNIGGVITNVPRAYLNRTALKLNMTADPQAFRFVDYKISGPVAPYSYIPMRHAPPDIVWPPNGIRLDILFKAPNNVSFLHKDVKVTVSYELYKGIPLLVKWVTIHAPLPDVRVIEGSIKSVEYLSLNAPWSSAGGGWMHVDTDQPHGTSVQWGTDPSAKSTPGSVQPTVKVAFGHDFSVGLVHDFVSFRVHELLVGTADQERFGLARRRQLRLLAPQTQENPIFFHLSNTGNDTIYSVINQMAEVGFEMLIFSFFTDFHIESTDPTYLKYMADVVRYANSKGIEVGGYDLIALTRLAPDEYQALSPGSMKPSGSACMASEWYDYLLERITTFINETGISVVELDGPYGNYPCASEKHPHHRNEQDSYYWQNKFQGQLFTILREKQIYINQPDTYFYQGGSKTGMGYNENQFSLPRWMDLSVSRQGMYDDMYHYIPTVGWMQVPLVMYHDGGAETVFEPLSDHEIEYEWALAQYLGAGVAACYRGYRLYDTEKTKSLVKHWVSFYKTYRQILISDIIHVKRADMQSIDSFLHVNPFIEDKGLAMMFNPTHEHIKINITLPLYYTGLTTVAKISHMGKAPVSYQLERDYSVEVPVSLGPKKITWYVIR